MRSYCLRAILLDTAIGLALLTGCSTSSLHTSATFPGPYQVVAYKPNDPTKVRVKVSHAAPKFFALVQAGTPVETAQSQPEDQTIGRNVTRPADYKYPDPPGSYMVSSAVFTQPQRPLFQNQ